MKEVMILVGMMLKEKLNIKYSWKFKNILRNFLPYIIKIALVAGISYLMFYFAAKYSVFGFFYFVPLTGVSIITTFIIFCFIVSTCISLCKDLYFNKDNNVLLTYPVKASKIYLSKIIVYYINDLSRYLTFVFPIFLGYGILIHLGVTFYIWSFVSMIFLAAVPLIFGMLLSIPLYYVLSFFKKHEGIKIIIIIISLAALITGVVLVILNLPPDLNFAYFWPHLYYFIQTLQYYFKIIFAPFYYLNVMVVGYPSGTGYNYGDMSVWYTLFVLIGAFVLTAVVTYFLNNKFYLRIATESLENTAVEVKISKKSNVYTNSTFLSLVKNEIILTIKHQNKNLSLIATYIIVPILVLLITRIFNSLTLNLTGHYLAMLFSLMIIIVPLLASNYVIATMFSSEGKQFIQLKTTPLSPLMVIMSKLSIPMFFSTTSIIISFIIFSLLTISEFTFFEYLILIASAIMLQYSTIFAAATKDINNPKFGNYINQSREQISINHIVIYILGFVSGLIYSGLFIIFSFENETRNFWVVFKLFIITLIYFIFMLKYFITSCKANYLLEDSKK